jgi:hypothetical protein
MSVFVQRTISIVLILANVNFVIQWLAGSLPEFPILHLLLIWGLLETYPEG